MEREEAAMDRIFQYLVENVGPDYSLAEHWGEGAEELYNSEEIKPSNWMDTRVDMSHGAPRLKRAGR